MSWRQHHARASYASHPRHIPIATPLSRRLLSSASYPWDRRRLAGPPDRSVGLHDGRMPVRFVFLRTVDAIGRPDSCSCLATLVTFRNAVPLAQAVV